MPSKISQIELNGVLYDIKDSEALKILNEGEQNEIVILSSNDKEVIASGTTLADIFARIDVATIVDHVENGEWIVNIVNSDGSIDMSNYYSKSRVDELIALSRAGLVANDDPRLSDARTPTAHTHNIADVTNLSSELGRGVEIVNPETGKLLYSFDEVMTMWNEKKILLLNGFLVTKAEKPVVDHGLSLLVYYLGNSEAGKGTALRKSKFRKNYTWYDEEFLVAEFGVKDIYDASGASIIDTYYNVARIPSNFYVVNATITSFITGGYGGTLDKSNVEILEAHNLGKSVWVQIEDAGGEEYIIPLSRIKSSNYEYPDIYFQYEGIDGEGRSYERLIRIDGSDQESYSFSYYESFAYYVTDVLTSEGVSLKENGVVTLPESPEIPTVPTSDINANTLARHTHSNKTVLDKFGESNGAPTYDGNTIGAVTDVQDSEGQSVVVNGIATIPEIPTVTVEDVRDSNNNSLVENGIAVIPEHNIDDYDIVALCASIDGVDAVTINGDYIGTDVNTAILF